MINMKGFIFILVFVLTGSVAISQIAEDSLEIRSISYTPKKGNGSRNKAVSVDISIENLQKLNNNVSFYKKKEHTERTNINNLKLSESDIYYIENIYSIRLVDGVKNSILSRNRINVSNKDLLNVKE